MGKSIRSKIKKRFRTAKRERVEHMVRQPLLEKNHSSLMEIAAGVKKTEKKTKNMFLHPNDPDAEIPQYSLKKPVDFRCEHLPMAGYAFRGNRRKYQGEEATIRDEKRKNHPSIEIIAGKGFVPKMEGVEQESTHDTTAESPDADVPMDVSSSDQHDYSAGQLPSSMMLPPELMHDADTKRVPVKRSTNSKECNPRTKKK